jgi:putative ABC transport system substrate-binding protein
MRRREFIAALIGAAGSMGSNLRLGLAETRARRALLAYLSSATQTEAAEFIGIFLNDLRQQGYVEGRDFDITYRFADRRYEQLEQLARQLVELNPDVIVTPAGDNAVRAIKAVTQQIPIVSPTLGDPIHLGLINSFSHPGGNVTGVATFVEHLPQKQLEIAVEALPDNRIFGALVSTGSGETAFVQQKEIEAASTSLGVKVVFVPVSIPDDFDAAFRTLAEQHVEAVIVPNDGMFVVQRRRIVTLAATARLPDFYSVRDAVIAGGFMSYGTSLRENFRRAAALVIKILQGAPPAQLPVEFPTKLELVVNLKAAKNLGLNVPATVLARADEVIE